MSPLGDLGLQGILQGLITISIGALIGIQTFALDFSSGHTVSIIGNSNTVSIIHNNLYHNNEYRLSFGFRMMWLLLMCLCVLSPWVQRFCLIENLVISVPLIVFSFLGMIASLNRIISGLYVVGAFILFWFIVTNYGLMDEFVGTYFLDKNTLQDALSNLNLTALFDSSQLDPIVRVINIVLAIFGITFLLLIQIKNAFSFLRYQGEFGDVLKLTVTNLVMSFIMILLASGVMDKLPNAWSLIKLVVYQILPLQALEP